LIGNEFQDLHGLFRADEYMPPRLAALESSGADSSGLTQTVMELSAALMFGSRNGMSLCGPCGRRGQVLARNGVAFLIVLCPVVAPS
jgi:hypothetical protein